LQRGTKIQPQPKRQAQYPPRQAREGTKLVVSNIVRHKASTGRSLSPQDPVILPMFLAIQVLSNLFNILCYCRGVLIDLLVIFFHVSWPYSIIVSQW
jgi:hypothetical protein